VAVGRAVPHSGRETAAVGQDCGSEAVLLLASDGVLSDSVAVVHHDGFNLASPLASGSSRLRSTSNAARLPPRHRAAARWGCSAGRCDFGMCLPTLL
jgi:hypothetical protein